MFTSPSLVIVSFYFQAGVRSVGVHNGTDRSEDYVFTLICKTYMFLSYTITIKEQCGYYAVFKNVIHVEGRKKFLPIKLYLTYPFDSLNCTKHNHKLDFFG